MRLGLELSKLGIASAVLAAAPQVVQAAPTAITGIQLESRNGGVNLQLQAANGAQLETLKTRYGQTLAIDIINTQLQLAQGEGFSRQNPASGIASVEVVQQYPNTVRVVLEGTDAITEAEVSSGPQGLSVAASTQQVTAQAPEEEEQEAPEAEGEPTQQQEQAQPEAGQQPQQQEPIELIVTPTRTEERETDVPRSVTVIDREEIEQQSTITRNVSEILGQTVPGFGPPNQSANTKRQSLRGRNFSVQIDGIPQFNNRRSFSQLQTIDPSAIERIEVVRGPTAIFGGNAAGGVINIITRSATDRPFSATSEVGTQASLTNLGDSLGFTLQQTLTGDLGDVDYRLTSSFEGTGGFFDAEGDRIPPSLGSGLLVRGPNSGTLNVLGKIGWDITDRQRLQFSVNHFNKRTETDFFADPSKPNDEKARAREVEGGIDFENKPGQSNTVLNLSYTHEELLGSQVDAQLFYRSLGNRGGAVALPGEDFGFPVAFQPRAQFERWGGRLDVETPLAEQDRLNLVWGLDYDKQVDLSQSLELLEDTRSGPGFNLEVTNTVGRDSPLVDVGSFGAFAQLDWKVTEDWNIQGGLRFDRITVSHNSFRPLDGRALFSGKEDIFGERVEAGERSFSDTVFNIGTTVDITDELNGFFNFAQAFEVPDFGRVIRNGVNVNKGIDRLQPQKIDQFEGGLRGNWDAIQASIVGFYTSSDLGISLEQVSVPGRPTDVFRQIRAPKQTWGIEAQLDWQPSDDWQLGSSVSWTEGKVDKGDNGSFERLGADDIQPVKITAYLENQTTSTWRNRLQLLWVGGRELDNSIATFNTDSYAVFDLISSVDLGSGKLRIAVENLLNNQYLPFTSQEEDENDAFSARPAGRGRTLSINYSIEW